MLTKIKELLKKYRSQIVYLIFGVLTTGVNYLVYIPCYHYLGQTAFRYASAASNTIAWVFAVIFAYLTNKPFVFGSHDWSPKVLLPEAKPSSGIFGHADAKFLGGEIPIAGVAGDHPHCVPAD